jgi:hypothetical protein
MSLQLLQVSASRSRPTTSNHLSVESGLLMIIIIMICSTIVVIVLCIGGSRYWVLIQTHTSEYVCHRFSKCFDQKVTISLTRVLDVFKFVLCS